MIFLLSDDNLKPAKGLAEVFSTSPIPHCHYMVIGIDADCMVINGRIYLANLIIIWALQVPKEIR